MKPGDLESKSIKWLLLFADVLWALLAFHISWYIRLGAFGGLPNAEWELGVFFLLILLVNQYVLGCYELNPATRFLGQIFRQAFAILVFFVTAISINYALGLDRSGFFGRGILLGSCVIFFFLALTMRYIVKRRISTRWNNLRALFLFDENTARMLRKDLDGRQFSQQAIFKSIENFGEAEAFKELFNEKWSFIVADFHNMKSEYKNILMTAKFDGQEVWDVSYFYERFFLKVPVEYIHAEWLLTTSGFRIFTDVLRLRIKRVADIGLAIIISILSAPLMVLATIFIKLESKGPAIFRQYRTGLRGRVFAIYKFRSMGIDAEKSGAQWAQKNDPRVTRVGKFIRLTRIDELPQLFNVLRGDMSFIGPRPERPEFNVDLEVKIPFYQLRHLVRPGLTGWAQVKYPYGASVDDAREKLQYDLYYIKNQGMFLDLRILLKTVSVVLFGKGR